MSFHPVGACVGMGLKTWHDSTQDIYVFGMGQTGIASAKFFAKRGNRVFIFDTRDVFHSSDSPIFPKVQQIDFDSIPDHALVLVSSAIPYDHTWIENLREKQCTLFTDLDVFFAENRAKIIAVTGTNGKTTVCRWLVECLRVSGFHSKAIGNIGVPVLDCDASSIDYWVIELSSFQLKWVRHFYADVGIILNVEMDHLDWHGNFEDYKASKYKLVEHSRSCLVPSQKATFEVYGSDKCFSIDESGRWVEDMQFLGAIESNCVLEHDQKNLTAVLSVFSILGLEIPWKHLSQLPKDRFRAEYWCDTQGVHWYNDSKATNVHAARSILEHCRKTYAGRLHWIAGGVFKEKEVDHYPIQVDWAGLFGQDREVLKNMIADNCVIKIEHQLEDLIPSLMKRLKKGDVVVFAPACASFDQYQNYIERGHHFKELVNG